MSQAILYNLTLLCHLNTYEKTASWTQGSYAVIKSHKSDNQNSNFMAIKSHKNRPFLTKAIKSHKFSGFLVFIWSEKYTSLC